MKKIKEIKSNYYKPTPNKWRKIGDAIQDISITASAVVVLFSAPPAWIPVLIFGIGRAGKIITNFAT